LAVTELQNSETFLTAAQVYARWGVSHMFVVDRLKTDPEMPKATYFGRHRRWKLSEIEAYEKILAARPRPTKKPNANAA
jgi:predicted DNA-binding transcriptional regulator AlpA